ncbi:MAG TPA: ROK family protein, partial [Firmicutes bacterium]|nr:ROK family protein [Bacillota bacterium]
MPTWVENDADACAWAEKWFGAARDRHDLVFLLADAGIGSGIIINDEIYRGRNAAGEVGHLTVDPNGLRCNCGNWECLETVASGLALVRRMAVALKGGAKSELAALTGGDPEAVRLEHLFLAAEHADPLVSGMLDEA